MCACVRTPWAMCDNMWDAQGRGIELFSGLQDVLNFVHAKPDASEWVVQVRTSRARARRRRRRGALTPDGRFPRQKYIERPLLLHGRKFDCRIWVLVTERQDIYLCGAGRGGGLTRSTL